MGKKANYSASFKFKVVLEALTNGKTESEVARYLTGGLGYEPRDHDTPLSRVDRSPAIGRIDGFIKRSRKAVHNPETAEVSGKKLR